MPVLELAAWSLEEEVTMGSPCLSRTDETHKFTIQSLSPYVPGYPISSNSYRTNHTSRSSSSTVCGTRLSPCNACTVQYSILLS